MATFTSRPIRTMALGLLVSGGCVRVPRIEPVPPAVTASPRPRADELTPEQRREIKQVAEAAKEPVKACFEAALRVYPGLKGKVVLRFQILFDGAVHGAEAVVDELGSPTLVGCLLAEAGRWRTGLRPAAPLTVEYPLVFRTASP